MSVNAFLWLPIGRKSRSFAKRHKKVCTVKTVQANEILQVEIDLEKAFLNNHPFYFKLNHNLS